MSLTCLVSCVFNAFFSYRIMLIDLLELLSFEKLDFFDDESDDDSSGSGSPGMCAFLFCSNKYFGSFGKYVGRVSGVGSSISPPNRNQVNG